MSCAHVAGMLAAVSVAFAAPLCRSSEGIQGRFPLFAPTYDMQSSTIIQPCNMTGFLEPAEFYAQFGVVDVDWSNAKSLWCVLYRQGMPPDCADASWLVLQGAASHGERRAPQQSGGAAQGSAPGSQGVRVSCRVGGCSPGTLK